VARVYVAGPLFTPQDRSVLETLASQVEDLGHKAVLPHRETSTAPTKGADDARRRQRELIRLLEGCDAVVALLDGVDVDGGTSFEIGYAHALNRPVLGLRSDARTGGEHDGVNLMVAAAVEIERVTTWTPEAARPALESFLSSVHVFAGRLVRDAVPRLAKERGHAIAFSQVDEKSYPRVVKRRLVEAARRIEAADYGVEQEEIADALELIESLIRARNYDKASLKDIKEGTWRKRGGYEKGYVVDEEPQIDRVEERAKSS
jgi:nucleoside 2-deoxyribosyltransferase